MGTSRYEQLSGWREKRKLERIGHGAVDIPAFSFFLEFYFNKLFDFIILIYLACCDYRLR